MTFDNLGDLDLDLAVSGGTIITMDRNKPMIEHGGIFIQDGEIIFVGKQSGLKKFGFADERIDVTGKFIFPGFINAHTHMFQVLLRSVGVDMDLLDWLQRVVWPIVKSLTADDIFTAARLGIVENIRSGVTCIVDNQYNRFYDAPLKAMSEMGVRGVMACGYYQSGVPEELSVEPDQALNNCEAVIKKWDKTCNGRLRVCPAPMHPIFISEELMLKSKELADKHFTYLHVHTAESSRDVKMLMDKTGKRDVEFLHSLGVLDNRFMAVHSVNVTEHEVKLLAGSGAHIVHNPVSNMYLGSGVAPIPEFKRLGGNVALGTDGPASNGTQDIVESMKFAACLHKVFNKDSAIINAKEVLEMATINGAKALGMEDQLGSIEVGKKGDLTIVDMFKPNSVHVHDPVGSLVYSAKNGDIDTVIVDGKVLLKNKKFAYVDEEKILRDADKVALEVMERART